ncbi:exodeoxyribonuclease VII large subunit [uncultured Ilyobacter sp.]|uniref:exodeoxyribonuclease VII large subunit n=1 Tax=uncultured Ilyobacter sp. TaxID=544433 RepID=UPI0029C6300D|nr:exodeoxyribonuclease VII large subunit [uncultured Ilyobacter sp.]
MEDRIYTVSQFNKMVKDYLEGNDDLKNFFLKGEISGVNYYKSGHLYFNLKDKNCQVKCTAFGYRYKKIPEDLKEGDSVKIFGDATLYEARGDFQIMVRHLEKENKMGALYEELERVKRELSAGGYFDQGKKIPMPSLPQTIGVVTSGNGAAVRDIINTARLRYPNINIYVYPAKVQGPGAAEEVIKGIEILNRIEEIDVIIAGRGGGSIEDLWTFNEKDVALAYYNSKKPIVSAVGHEIDILLTDFTADLRSSTPTHASEMIVPEKKKLQEAIENREKYLKSFLGKYIHRKRDELRNRRNSFVIKNFQRLVQEKNMEVLDREREFIRVYERYLLKKKQELEMKREKLNALNPKNILKRGYSITTAKGRVVKNSHEIKVGEILETTFYTGKTTSVVKEIDIDEEGVI